MKKLRCQGLCEQREFGNFALGLSILSAFPWGRRQMTLLLSTLACFCSHPKGKNWFPYLHQCKGKLRTGVWTDVKAKGGMDRSGWVTWEKLQSISSCVDGTNSQIHCDKFPWVRHTLVCGEREELERNWISRFPPCLIWGCWHQSLKRELRKEEVCVAENDWRRWSLHYNASYRELKWNLSTRGNLVLEWFVTFQTEGL